MDEASWYPDPLGRAEMRYWDGTSWTEHVFAAGAQAIDPLQGASSNPFRDGHVHAGEENSVKERPRPRPSQKSPNPARALAPAAAAIVLGVVIAVPLLGGRGEAKAQSAPGSTETALESAWKAAGEAAGSGGYPPAAELAALINSKHPELGAVTVVEPQEKVGFAAAVLDPGVIYINAAAKPGQLQLAAKDETGRTFLLTGDRRDFTTEELSSAGS